MIPHKGRYGTVIVGLSVFGEEAAGYLPVLPVIGHALAAQSLARAGRIGASAGLNIAVFVTFHMPALFIVSMPNPG
jgi:hypothetical protein